MERQRLALGSVANLLDDVGAAGSDVEIVVNGPAISVLTVESILAADLLALRTRGVALLACSNSMVAADIASGDLIVGVTVIPSGI